MAKLKALLAMLIMLGAFCSVSASEKGKPHKFPATAPKPEPWGVALTVDQNPSAVVRLEWGRSRKEVEAELTRVTGKTGMFLLVCQPGDRGESECSNEHFSWRLDFGNVTDVRPDILLFAPDGRFFAYTAAFGSSNFPTVFDALEKRLGTARVSSSQIHNKAGGTFDQQTAIWSGTHTVVKLELIGKDRDTSRLTAVYLPIDRELGSKVPDAPM
jgi:hypothetical protein